jgi:hypothetical protein
MYSFVRVAFAASLALGVCVQVGHGQAAQTRTLAGDSQPVTLSAQIEVQSRGSHDYHVVQPGETLHSGDQLRVWVEVDRPAYVRVAVGSKGGVPTTLFPLPGASKEAATIAPRVQTAIPTGGATFELDEEIGEESVEIVASTRPLDGDAGASGAVAGKPAGQPTLVALSEPASEPPPPPPPPYPPTISERRITAKGSSRLRVQSNREGVAVARFRFWHAAAANAQPR